MAFTSLRSKFVVIIAVALAGIIALAPLALYSIRNQMMTDRQAKIQQMVELGHGILAHYQKLESGGKLSREQAQAAALAEIKELRYDKVEFFWINDMAPNMVMSSSQARTRRQAGRRIQGSDWQSPFSRLCRRRTKAGCRLLQLSLAQAGL